jgi:O-antigen/teichoic acid export membrane protein
LSSGRRGELWWGADWLLVLVMVVVVVLLLLLPPPWPPPPPPPPLLRLLLLWLLLLLLLAGVADEFSWAQLMNSRRARRRASPNSSSCSRLASLTFFFLPAFLPRLSDDGGAPRCAVLAGGSTPVARVASRFDTTVRRASRSPSAERPS